MAEKDAITKEYMQDNEVFADMFNYFMYDGRQVIKPEQLMPLDTTEIAVNFDDNNNSESVQKYRDVLKRTAIMHDNRATYLILGIENQSDIHYAMPVRNMLYDAIQYDNQVKNTAKKHRQNKDKAETQCEYISGFYSIDKLTPVISLTLLWNADEWTAPTDLYNMMDADEEMLKYISNYKLNLVTPAGISEKDFEKFHTELRYALKYVKYSKDKTALENAVHEDNAYRKLSRRTANMVNVVTGSKLKFDEGKEDVDMCKAIEDMRNDAIMDEKIVIALKLLARGKETFEEIAEDSGLSIEKVEELAKSNTVSA